VHDEAGIVRNELVAEIVDGQLWETLRVRAGASYVQDARAHHFRGGAAHLEAWADVRAPQLPLAIDTIRALMNPTAPPPVDAPTLERFRWVLARRSNLRSGNSDALAQALFDRWNMGWSVGGLDEYPARLAEVTLEDLTRTFAACRANAVLTVVGDVRGIAAK
jgi:hypothetical protein